MRIRLGPAQSAFAISSPVPARDAAHLMNPPLSPQAAAQAVVWGGLIAGLALGAAAQASRFCVRGAIADWYVSGSRSRMLSWVLAVAVAMLGTQLIIGMQFFDASRSLPWSERFVWLSYLVGGLAFGYGMVLSAGCPQRSLVKAGSGNLRSIVTLVVAALAALMTLRGVLAPLRASGLDAFSVQLSGPQDLGSVLASWLPGSAGALRAAVLAVLLGVAAVWLWRRRGELTRVQWIGSVIVGLLVPAAWLLTGYVGHVPEHPETLEPAWMGTQSRRPESLSFIAPIANTVDLLTFWTDANTVATFGVVLAAGVLAGSFLSSRVRGEFKLESFGSARELRDHMIGGLLMGFGGVTALGCSIGQGVTGLAMLSAGAFIAVPGIVAGALLALRWRSAPARRGAPEALPSSC
jgi:uncharacterized membrane protein YedE/YeeE